MHPAVHKYLYYLHKSEMFNKDRAAYLALVKKEGVESKLFLDELKEKYEIPKYALEDFICLLHQGKADPFINYELHVTRKDEARNFHVPGPAITLTIKSRLSRPQFESLWEAVNKPQVWKNEAMKIPADLGEPFKPIIFDKPKDFDVAFAIYRERKLNPKMPFRQIAEKFRDNLLKAQGEEYVKRRFYMIHNLIEDMKSANQPPPVE